MWQDPTIFEELENVNGKDASSDDMMKTARDLPKLLVWSAADERGILRLQEIWKSHFFASSKINTQQPQLLNNIAHTLASRRTPFPWRAFAVSRPTDSLDTLFDKFSSATQAHTSPNLAMIFSGVCSIAVLKMPSG
jgi:hypothetical protein